MGSVEEDFMDNIFNLSKDSDMSNEDQGWQLSRPKKRNKTKKRQVIGATRMSSRLARDGVPIVTKAINRAQERDNISGIISQNPFAVFNSISSGTIHSVMLDLDIECHDIVEQVGAFRAEELARAAIAEAQYKIYLEKQKDKTAPQTNDELQDLSLGVIANINRLGNTSSSMGDEDCSMLELGIEGSGGQGTS